MRMILIIVIAAVAVAGCSSGEEGGRPSIVASTGILAEITAAVGGENVEVVQLIPDAASPHEFQASAEDRRHLAEADLVTYNGAGLDASIPFDAGAATWALAEHTPAPLPFAEEGHGEKPHPAEGDEHGEEQSLDPHVWMDPRRVSKALPSLAAALGDIDPEHSREYERRAGTLAKRLRRLDHVIARRIATIPPRYRELVTSHDAMGYFADRYDLTVVATAFPATGAEAEPSAAALAEVIDAVRETRVPALFAEETDDPEVLDAVASETGAEVVDTLHVESPGSAGTYEAMLRHDAGVIVDALRGR